MSDDTSKLANRMGGKVPPLAVWATAGAVVLLVLAIAVPLYVTSRPGFFARYGAYAGSLKTQQASVHHGIQCSDCHADPRGNTVYRAALVADFYAGLLGKPYQPMFVKMTQPTRRACLSCHLYDWSDSAQRTSKVPHPAHLRTVSETRDCAACHRWTAHEETYQSQHKKMPFSTVCASFPCHSGYKQPRTCSNCHHQLQQSLGVWKASHPKVVLASGQNGCLEKCHTSEQCRTCHTTGKTPVFPKTIATSTVTAIEKAHVKSDWLTQHGTFALQDQSRCLTCHVTLTECEDCHSHRPAFHGTDNTAWIGTKHGKLASDKRRCYECHQNSECASCHDQFGVKNVKL